jgi:hypothetical protein
MITQNAVIRTTFSLAFWVDTGQIIVFMLFSFWLLTGYISVADFRPVADS